MVAKCDHPEEPVTNCDQLDIITEITPCRRCLFLIYFHIWLLFYIFDNDIQNEIATAFCNEMEAAHYYCGIYSSASPLTYNFDSSVTNRYTIWVAHYGVDRPSFSGEYDVWQKGSGPVAGAGDDCDIDEGYTNFEPIMKKYNLNGY